MTAPDGLYPGPDGTFYGPLRAVPTGWEFRTCDGVDWLTVPDRRWVGIVGIVQARPARPRTERVPWHEAVGRTLPDGREVVRTTRWRNGVNYLTFELSGTTVGDMVEVLVADDGADQ